jgi:hypothetical protein
MNAPRNMPGNKPARKTVAGNLLHAFSSCAELVLAPGVAVEVELEPEVELFDVEGLEEELEPCVDDALVPLEELGEAGDVSEVPDLLELVSKLQTGREFGWFLGASMQA